MMRACVAVLVALLFAVPPSFAQDPPAVRSPIGINLSGPQSYTSAFPFADVFKVSSPWCSGHGDVWDDKAPVDVDEHGWVRSLRPGQVVHCVFIALGGRAPKGRYTVSYQGDGELVFQEAARLIESTPGRALIEVDPERGNCYFDIVRVNPRDHLRDIRILLPGAPRGETFNPVYLQRIAPFKLIRFMGWMLGDNPEQIEQRYWTNRPRVTDARWSERGVPLEVMIELANRNGADAWFSLPQHADDDYVRRFAAVVREQLDSKRKIYVEHSNEVWNPTFSVYPYASKRGLELGLSTDPDEARWRYHCVRSRQLFEIFKEALGRDRIVRVLATQTDVPELSEKMLGYDGMASHVDVLAIGAYVGYELGLPENQARVRRMSPAQLLRELESVHLPELERYWKQDLAIAARHTVRLIGYEGGQHLSGVGKVMEDAAINALFDAANRDRGMNRLYTRLLERWSAVTGGVPLALLDECGRMGAYGRWGLLEYIDQPRAEAPKYDAVLRFIEGR